ncbi:MAG: hypothetical protein H6981_13010 [Gammaproteobacteria bacterium]|nr:hypothetical protein [Gammaproteobacteria bacterium]MCP5137708.1 hypothetical protein [Gammaproteobacteria bacterium]
MTALLMFLLGVAYAIHEAAIDPADIDPGPFFGIMLILSPLTVLLSALQLRYAAEALGQIMPLPSALTVTAVAMASNMLPLPGAYLVRTRALAPNMTGTDIKRAAAINLLAAKQWVALSVLVFAVVLTGLLPGWITVPALVGGIAVLGLNAVLWRKSGFPVRCFGTTLAIQAAMISVETARIAFAFAALGATLGIRQAFALSIAAVVGSLAGMVPGGLGVRELSAAGIALLIAIDPEIAFAATALNRIAGLVVLAIATGAITWRAARRKSCA